MATVDGLIAALGNALGPDYRIERELDGGGMSRVFVAIDLRHERPVVVKTLPPDLISTQSTQRFRREVDIMARLQHPHILPVLTSGAWPDGLYYITPYVTGESLRARIGLRGRMPFADVVKILGDIASAVAYAHSKGFVHRDIKPGNILFSEGEAILADFGIARRADAAATPITTSGIMLGTPAYMAPEMATDERGDVYALGVVGYEMLTGSLPSFGTTAADIVAARGHTPGDQRWRLAALAAVIARAIQPSLATRTISAQALVDDLEQSRRRWKPRQVARVAAVAAASLALVAYGVLRMPRTALSATRYLVTAVGPADSLSIRAAHAVEDRLVDWRDIASAPNADQRDTGAARTPRSVRDALARAAASGARNLVVVSARPGSDGVAVEAVLYDVNGDSALKTQRVTVERAATDTDVVMPYRRLLNGVLRDEEPLPWRSQRDRTRASLIAWTHYDAARSALQRWDLNTSEHAFRDAVATDPQLGTAHFWLAQTLVWQDASQENEIAAEATRSLANGVSLSARDSAQAVALVAYAKGNYAAACAGYRAIGGRDSTDFAAWLGLADCERRDRTIQRSSRTTTGWAFRTSFEDAARAYRRASVLADAAGQTGFRGWFLGRLGLVLLPATNLVRGGYVGGRDTTFMASRPYLDHDTVAYAPYPIADFATLKGDPPHDLVMLAVARNRDVLRGFAEDWVQRAPTDAAALDSLASWSELSGGYATVGGRRVQTFELLHRARALMADSTEQVRLAIEEVRDLLKRGEFAATAEKADSLIQARVTTRFPGVNGLAGVTALLGRLRETILVLPQQPAYFRVRLRNGSVWTPPRPVEEAAAALLTYASFGSPIDSVRLFARRTTDLVHSFVQDSAEAERIVSVIVAGPLSYVDPRALARVGYRLTPPDEAARPVLLFAQGDTAGARRQLVRALALQSTRMPGDGLGFAFRLASLSLALGDTAAAERQLDGILQGVPALNNTIFTEVFNVASLVRAFAMRAELAHAARDDTVARASALAIETLLRGADAGLDSMRHAARAASIGSH